VADLDQSESLNSAQSGDNQQASALPPIQPLAQPPQEVAVPPENPAGASYFSAPPPTAMPKAKSGKSRKTLVIALVSVVLLAGAGSAAYFFLLPALNPDKTTTSSRSESPKESVSQLTVKQAIENVSVNWSGFMKQYDNIWTLAADQSNPGAYEESKKGFSNMAVYLSDFEQDVVALGELKEVKSGAYKDKFLAFKAVYDAQIGRISQTVTRGKLLYADLSVAKVENIMRQTCTQADGGAKLTSGMDSLYKSALESGDQELVGLATELKEFFTLAIYGAFITKYGEQSQVADECYGAVANINTGRFNDVGAWTQGILSKLSSLYHRGEFEQAMTAAVTALSTEVNSAK
jgi:hypothetical protein